MKTVLFVLLLLLSPLTVVAEWTVVTPVVNNGELFILRWQGENPPDMMIGSFNDKTFYSETAEVGLFALVGVDINAPSGQRPIEIISVDKLGELDVETLLIEVTEKDRGVSRITLPPEMVTPKGTELLDRIEREHLMLLEIFSQESGPLLAGSFRRPVPDEVNSHFGKKRILNGLPRAPHSGTDFRSPSGRLIRSPASGDVVLSEDLYYTGNTVILDHGAGLYSLYAHLSQPLCSPGQRLGPGQPLGKVGSTGRSTGAHLHWTVRLREARIDPMTILERFGTKTP